MQHRDAGAAHPQSLRRGGDFHRRARQHTDRIAVPDPRGGEATGHSARTFVDVTPGVPDRMVRFARHHPVDAPLSVCIHVVREAAHDNPSG